MSPLIKQQVDSTKDRARACALKELIEANSRWNQTRRDTSANDLRRTVDETSTINLELRKEMLYSWERVLSKINQKIASVKANGRLY